MYTKLPFRIGIALKIDKKKYTIKAIKEVKGPKLKDARFKDYQIFEISINELNDSLLIYVNKGGIIIGWQELER